MAYIQDYYIRVDNNGLENSIGDEDVLPTQHIKRKIKNAVNGHPNVNESIREDYIVNIDQKHIELGESIAFSDPNSWERVGQIIDERTPDYITVNTDMRPK